MYMYMICIQTLKILDSADAKRGVRTSPSEVNKYRARRPKYKLSGAATLKFSAVNIKIRRAIEYVYKGLA